MSNADSEQPLPPPDLDQASAAEPTERREHHRTPASRPSRAHHHRVGQLTVAWQAMVSVAWATAFFALAGVWKASEEIGIATWWLGPRANPQPVVVRIIPFVIIVLVALWAIYNAPGVPWISLGGSVAIAVIAVFDIPRSAGLAIAEFAVAGALLAVTLGSFGGRYVLPAAGDDETQPPLSTPPAPPSTAGSATGR